MDDIIAGEFSRGMMADWAEDDAKLFGWREETGKSAFENASGVCWQDCRAGAISIQWRGDGGYGKAGVELAFETMWWPPGIYEESAYYESPARAAADRQHRRPQASVRNERSSPIPPEYTTTIRQLPVRQRRRAVAARALPCRPLKAGTWAVPEPEGRAVDNPALLAANEATRNHPIEEDGQDPARLRKT